MVLLFLKQNLPKIVIFFEVHTYIYTFQVKKIIEKKLSLSEKMNICCHAKALDFKGKRK